MARLICVEHRVRVLVLDTKTIHRSDRQTCNSILEFDGERMTSDQVRQFKLTPRENLRNTKPVTDQEP